MNNAIEIALRTWYPKDHPLHFKLHHPLGKLVGEWGELLDDYMKYLAKPGYEWEPINELIDIWYYIRILSYQSKIEVSAYKIDTDLIDYLISLAIEGSNYHFKLFIIAGSTGVDFHVELNHNYSILCRICELNNLTIDQLTEASWEKLKPGSVRGDEWRKASKL